MDWKIFNNFNKRLQTNPYVKEKKLQSNSYAKEFNQYKYQSHLFRHIHYYFFQKLLIHFPYLLKIAPHKVKNNRQFLYGALNKNSNIIKYVSSSIQNDLDYLLLFFHFPQVLTILHITLQEEHNKTIFSESYRESKALKEKKELLIEYFKGDMSEENCIKILLAAQDERCYSILNFIPNQFKQDLSFWLIFLKQSAEINLFIHYLNQAPLLKLSNEQYNLTQLTYKQMIEQLPYIIEKENLAKKILIKHRKKTNKI